jgi:hypothetical protein
MPDATFFTQVTPGAVGIWTLVAMVGIALIKAWPAIKAKVNEARQIELEADGKLRGDLLKRINDLETQLRSERAAGDERHAKCERELRDVRSKLDGVVRQFLAFQMATARAIPLVRSPEMSQALDTLEGFLEPKHGEEKE